MAFRIIPLGINARGEMVGVYADTSGAVHGFLLSQQQEGIAKVFVCGSMKSVGAALRDRLDVPAT